MRFKRIDIIFFVILSLCCVHSIEAIGGRGGGGGRGGAGRGGGGGGAHRQASRPQFQGARPQPSRPQMQNRGQQFSRSNFSSPSMSRADRPNFSNQGRSLQGYSSAARPSQSQVQQFLQQNPASAASTLRQQQSLRNSYPQVNRANAQTAARAVSQFNDQHPRASNWFNDGFFSQHQYHPNYYNGNANLWAAAGWATAAGWMGLNTLDGGYPAYYYDNNDELIYLSPQDATTYSSPPQQYSQPYQNSQTYQSYSQPSTQSTTVQGDWLPLGVFAIGADADQAAYSNMVIQLSLNKDGKIAGTYYNSATDQTYPIEGSVDKTSQQAVWQLSDKPESPVATTGLYNLTQDMADIRVYFPDGSEQQRVLVRLNQTG